MDRVRILGIESSCDETGVAIYDKSQGIIAHQLYSQVKVHREYGGVVPELASRDHVRKIIPLINATLQEAQCQPEDITALSYTQGPGLIGALLVGATVAKSLAYAWGKPTIGIHHLEGHLLAPLLEDKAPEFPFLALLVSGGHTMLVDVKALGQYEIIGESIDDAAGEAFDKTAKIMGLDYPGGPLLAKLATEGKGTEVRFPRPMTDRPGLDFSFSGLKTFAANRVMATPDTREARAEIALAFQDAVIDTLAIKSKRALKQTGYKRLVVAGGVSANISLRAHLKKLMTELGGSVYYPRQAYCTDNGAMIAYAGFCRHQLLKGDNSDSMEDNSGSMKDKSGSIKDKSGSMKDNEHEINVFPRWPLSEI